jgi:hypothetical protein
VLRQDVDPLVEQCLGGVAFLGGIVPGIGPHDLDLDVRVHGLRAEEVGVDARHHLRDREGADIADRP